MSIARDMRDVYRKLLDKWRADPVAFCRDVLGFEPWDHPTLPSQADILRAAATHTQITVRSGHKVGKSRLVAALAIWEYVCWPGSRTIVTAPTGRQIKEVVWREIRTLAREAARRGFPIGGQIALDPGTGLKNYNTDTQVIGFSTDDADRFSGFSAARVTYIVDEASGFADALFGAMFGNMAGGGRIILVGNPTQPTGLFFDSHNRSKSQYKCFHIRSSDVAEAVEDGEIPVIPGIAQQKWVNGRIAEWGVDSLEYQVRVLGEFPNQGKDSIVALVDYNKARARHKPIASPNIEEPIDAGLDVARFGDDESVLCFRRGLHVFEPQGWKGIDGPNLAHRVVASLSAELRPAEGQYPGTRKPVIRVDVTGGTGASAYDTLVHQYADNVIAVPVQFAAKAMLSAKYVNKRAEMWFQARDFIKSCELPNHQRLRDDLLAPRYRFDKKLRYQVEPKDDIKKRIGHSPDFGDAFILCCDKTAAPDPAVKRAASVRIKGI